MKRLMKRSLMAAVCVATAGGALGQQAVTLDLDAAAAGTNRFDIAVSGLGASDTASTDFSGSVDALLNLTFDAGNNPTTTGLEFTGGALSATDVSLTLVVVPSIIEVDVDLTGLGATVDTPTPPGSVTGTQFDTGDHLIIINQGNVSAAGENIDLSTSPVNGTTTGTGTLLVTLNNVTNNIATYDVVLTLPVDFSDTFQVANPLGGADVDVDVAVNGGDVVARGQFTRQIPEPGSLALLGLGGLALVRRRRA